MTQATILRLTMTPKEQQLITTLGKRIAELRLESGYTQQVLAEELGIAQQTLAHYEVGRLRMPVTLLPNFARIFAVPIDDLLGVTNGKSKRGPASNLQRQIEQVGLMPRAKQKFITEMLDALIKQQQAAQG